MSATVHHIPSFDASQEGLAEPVRTPFLYRYPEASDTSVGRDAILPPDAGVTVSSAPTATLAEALATWRQQIASEELIDVTVPYYRTHTHGAMGLRLRESDGALLRRQQNGALALQPHAWSQLISLLMVGQSVPGLARSLAWLTPPVRRYAFGDAIRRSGRPEGEKTPMLLRSHIDPRTGLRALRAVVSGRHSGIHFDDLALAQALERLIPADAPAHVSRAIEHTYGFAILDPEAAVAATLNWGNSEVCAGSLTFSAGCFIRVVGAVARFRNTSSATEIEEVAVSVASAAGRTRRIHTLPRARVSEKARAEIAQTRMASDIQKASEAAQTLSAQWDEALKSRPSGLGEKPTNPRMAAEVLLDYIEETKGNLGEEFRKALAEVLAEDRIRNIPWGSAAYIAAGYALLAATRRDLDSMIALQERAGDWIIERW